MAEHDGPGAAGLSLFHPAVSAWFKDTFDRPTPVQTKAWPLIAAGGHVLFTAPTGSGKTLTAFLWAISRILYDLQNGREPARILYISPLKALNADIHENLQKPLKGISALEPAAGGITTAVRSSDTTSYQRRRQKEDPPHIFITTPESLAILLAQSDSDVLLGGLQTVIIDEVHYLFPDKRGALLSGCLEMLEERSRHSLQRIGASATARPLDGVARFLGGYTEGRPRPVSVVEASGQKKIDTRINYPAAEEDEDSRWPVITRTLVELIEQNRSTLIFAASRKQVEKVSRLINEEAGSTVCYAHHGSLSRAVRQAAEEKLRSGSLRALAATSTMELGIDVGEIDEVVLLNTPSDVASAFQRIGRSGHRIDALSRGCFIPTHSRDLIDAWVMHGLVDRQIIEEKKAVNTPLDVLAQCLLITALGHVEPCSLHDTLSVLARSAAFFAVTDEQVEGVMAVLSGRFRLEQDRPPKPLLQQENGRFSAAEHARMHYYRNGGTIIDRGYFPVILNPQRTRLGELDEEFVWERRVGEVIRLGNSNYRIESIRDDTVEVTMADRGARAIDPFWKAEQPRRSGLFQQQLLAAFEQIERHSRLQTGDEPRSPVQQAALLRTSVEKLSAGVLYGEALDEAAGLFQRQWQVSRAFPTTGRILIEQPDNTDRHDHFEQLVMLNMWGLALNQPLAFALQAAWLQSRGGLLRTFSHQDGLSLLVPRGFDLPGFITDLPVEEGDLCRLVATGLENSPFFAALFLENASRFMLLPRRGFNRRTPRWLTRKRAAALQEMAGKYNDFVVTVECFRSAFDEYFDLPGLARRIRQIKKNEVTFYRYRSVHWSPLAADLAWYLQDSYIYDTEESRLKAGSDTGLQLSAAAALENPPALADLLAEQRRRLGWSAHSSAADLFSQFLLIPAGLENIHELLPLLSQLSEQELFRLNAGGHTWYASAWSAGLYLDLFENRPAVSVSTAAGRQIENTEHQFLVDVYRNSDGRLLSQDENRAFFAERSLYSLVYQSADQFSALFSEELLSELISSRRVSAFESEGIRYVMTVRLLSAVMNRRRLAGRKNLQVRPAHLQHMLAAAGGLVPLSLDDYNSEDSNHQAASAGVLQPGEMRPGNLAASWESLLYSVVPAKVFFGHVVAARGSLESWHKLCLEEGISWYGSGHERIYAAFAGSPAGRPADKKRAGSETMLPPGRFSLSELTTRLEQPLEAVFGRLFKEAWQGRVFCDSWSLLEWAARNRFRLPASARRQRFRALARDNLRLPSGYWSALPAGQNDETDDLLEQTEQQHELLQLVLERCSVLFRSLFDKENLLSWSSLRGVLSRMELAGEVNGGMVIEGVDELQFIRPGFEERFEKRGGGFYLLHACDPVSLCGRVPSDGELPPRMSNAVFVVAPGGVVFSLQGRKMKVPCRQDGRVVFENRLPGGHDCVQTVEQFSRLFRAAFTELYRRSKLTGSAGVSIEQVNGEAVKTSVFYPILVDAGFTASSPGRLSFSPY